MVVYGSEQATVATIGWITLGGSHVHYANARSSSRRKKNRTSRACSNSVPSSKSDGNHRPSFFCSFWVDNETLWDGCGLLCIKSRLEHVLHRGPHGVRN